MKNDMRLINAGDLEQEIIKEYYTKDNPSGILNRIGEEIFNTAIDIMRCKINDADTIDAAPVVRCKQCKYARELRDKEKIIFVPACMICEHPYGSGVSYPEHDIKGRVVWTHGYCSYGDRKHNEKADGGINNGE